jgi:hypothetical protein
MVENELRDLWRDVPTAPVKRDATTEDILSRIQTYKDAHFHEKVAAGAISPHTKTLEATLTEIKEDVDFHSECVDKFVHERALAEMATTHAREIE